MAGVWSDEGKLARWLDVELAALDGWAEVGVVPAEAVERSARRRVPPDPAARGRARGRAHHDTAAFVDAVAEQLGEEGRWFHYGLTSSDVVDTALSLQLHAAGELVLDGVDRAFAAVVARADEHRDTLCIGRTHGVHAEPTTFGLKLAGWAFELDRRPHAARAALETCRVGKLSGAVGSTPRSTPRSSGWPASASGSSRRRPRPRSSQRDRHAELMTALARRSRPRSTRSRLEIRHLARTEVREVEEPFATRSEGLVGDAAQAQPGRRRAHLRARARRPRGTRSSRSRTCRSGTSATSRTRRRSGS